MAGCIWSYLDLESKDDCPDETECEPGRPVDNVVCAHVFQVDSLLVQEAQGLVHVLQAVDSHLALGGPRLQRRITQLSTGPFIQDRADAAARVLVFAVTTVCPAVIIVSLMLFLLFQPMWGWNEELFEKGTDETPV